RRKRGWEGGGGGGTSYADRRKSKVWNYYRKSGDAYVECNVCKKQLSFHNSTTTMREHLARKHGIRDAPLAHPKDEGGGDGERAARETGGENPRRAAAAAYPVGADSGSEALAELVLGLVFRDLHPLTVVKDRGFGLLVGYLEPGARLPTPAQLGEALRRRYGCVRQRLERYLRTAQAVTLSAERWRSSLGQTYVTLAANLVDGEWRRARCALETRPAPYDGGDSREGFGAVLSAFGLAGKTLFCVTDDGEAGEAGGSELGCAARTLQLCV
ncbi:RSLE3 protein, partial [Rhynochetos jubatus]|nr:RSLE3 protein [Rhynochetos jubatus]